MLKLSLMAGGAKFRYSMVMRNLCGLLYLHIIHFPLMCPYLTHVLQMDGDQVTHWFEVIKTWMEEQGYGAEGRRPAILFSTIKG